MTPGADAVRPRGPGAIPDTDMINYRLGVWKRLAVLGVPAAEIADRLNMKLAALNQLVYRQRKRGHPSAVYHADAPQFAPASTLEGSELARRLHIRALRQARRRRQREQAAREARNTFWAAQQDAAGHTT